MANETISLGTDPGGNQFWSGGFGCFFRFPAAPSARTALLDLSGGAGYLRLSLGTDLTVLFEINASPWNVPNLTSAVLSPGVWYWMSAGAAADGNQGTHSGLLITQAGSTVSAPTGSNGLFHTGRVDVTGVFAVGVPISSAYAAFPNDAPGGWRWSKPRIMPTNQADHTIIDKGGPFAAPTSDWTLGGVGSLGGAWNCREAVGPVASLDDISSNDISLVAAGQGLTVTTDGPYP